MSYLTDERLADAADRIAAALEKIVKQLEPVAVTVPRPEAGLNVYTGQPLARMRREGVGCIRPRCDYPMCECYGLARSGPPLTINEDAHGHG